jgi:predicted amidohydrolase YtcJ
VLNRVALAAHRRGYQLALHAAEMETVEAAVTALEYVLRHEPHARHRHRIEHCSVCPPPLIRRIRQVGALVVTQPSFLFYGGDRYLATVAPQEQEWLYPVGSLCAAGVRVAASSDVPVVPLNPLSGIYAAVTRRTESGQQVGMKEGVSPMQALRLHTIEGAYCSFEEGSKASIREGMLADMVVLSKDPAMAAPEEIRDIEVTMTILNGEIVWQR